MIINGVDVSDLTMEVESGRKKIDTVRGRVVHIDADFMAYMVAYDDSKPIVEMQHNTREMIQDIKDACGAETAVLHLTPSGSNKGKRYELALLKEYQGNRKSKPKPKWLPYIREWMHNELDAIMHMDLEADDGMAIAQYKAIAEGNSNLSVIATKDKDLGMVPGLMMDWDSGELNNTETDFGWIELDRSKKTVKLRGRGWIFFFAQILMGDTADNISGLPRVCCPKIVPQPKACGPVMAYEILSKCKTIPEAFSKVKHLFELYSKKFGFKNYRDGSKVTGSEALISEMQLLWMRRQPDENDVLHWLKEHAV